MKLVLYTTLAQGLIREDLPEDDGDELLQALEKAAIALGPGTSCMTSIDED